MNNLEIELILEKDGVMKLIPKTHNIKTIPKENEYVLDFLSKNIYKVDKVIHMDLHIVLIVNECELNGKELNRLIYNLN